MADLLAIVLAAGKGTRMKSNLTKVLHPVAGQAMVKHVLDSVSNLTSQTVTVIGHQAEKVKTELVDYRVEFVEQKEQLGTAHAVMQAETQIKKHKGPVLILYGDTPLLTEDTLKGMATRHQKRDEALTVLTAKVKDPTGYGRIIRNSDQTIARIVEEDDATEKESQINEINSGVYCFDSDLLEQALAEIDCNNAQGEYYLTDAVSYINKKGNKVGPIVVEDSQEIMGINDRRALASAEKILRQQINERQMEKGVSIIDPLTTYIDKNVNIGRDTVIYPFTYIEGSTTIGRNTVIGPHSRLVNSEIGNNVELKSNSNIWKSSVEDDCIIGPYAYIRPGCKVSQGVKVGDFVELKKANIGEGTKVPHLSYVGDANIGANTNVGAGTIFANYDGKNKHKTKVGNSVFIGSNTTLVAPVEIKDYAKTGAGSVVTHDVSKNDVVVGVPARLHKDKNEDWDL
jgi:bifunctional UDP-N-acetylglucosamine pyrophosphorylase/glucosamine-1-phosphate N-acetyltransferase